ncbi:MAG: type II secretion system major pseudopilin GspG [Planctomycetaceae bacterium]|nr:type II secretion system major pseudopilin GspG [Planctomycetaceae bacterium]
MKTNKKQNKRRGFTLVEIMLVLVIMVSIAALGVGTFVGVRQQADIQKAKIGVQNLVKSIELYQVNVGAFPNTAEGLDALVNCPSSISNPDKWIKLVKGNSVPLDPWDHPFQYQYPGSQGDDSFDLWSCGPDGISGTDDDITNTSI